MSHSDVWTLWLPGALALAGDADAMLSADELRRAAAFRHERDRLRYVVAHVWLRRLLGQRLSTPPAAVEIRSAPCLGCGGPHGKPLLDPASGWHFSLSHAGDAAVAAVTSVPVGVDVEKVPSGAAAAELLEALHPQERAAVLALPTGRRAEAVAACWVRKEAYLKATGEGLNRDPQTLNLGAGSRFDGRGESGAAAGWELRAIDVRPGYAAALARRASIPTPGGRP